MTHDERIEMLPEKFHNWRLTMSQFGQHRMVAIEAGDLKAMMDLIERMEIEYATLEAAVDGEFDGLKFMTFEGEQRL